MMAGAVYGPQRLNLSLQRPDAPMTSLSCRDRLEHALFRIAEPDGEGIVACLTVYSEAARADADAADARPARWRDRKHQGFVRRRRRTDARWLENSRRRGDAGSRRCAGRTPATRRR